MISSYLKKFQKGLKKTQGLIKSGFAGLFQRDKKVAFSEAIEDLEQVLIESDLGVDLVYDIVDEIKEKGIMTPEEVKSSIAGHLKKEFLNVSRSLKKTSKPGVILFVGINGAGKTTSISKIARKLINSGDSVLLAAGDTFRAAAVEQLTIWSERLNVGIVKHKMGADAAAVAHDACESAKARDIDHVLVDTAGRLHNQSGLMEELKKIKRVITARIGEDNLETLLVIDGNAGQNSLVQAETFHRDIGLDGIVITKLDGTAKGGVVVSVEKKLGIPVKYIGVGEQWDDLIEFDTDAFIDALFNIDEEIEQE